MADTGVTYPGTAATQAVSPEDDYDWVNPNNIKTDDADYASVNSGSSGTYYSYRLKATNFGFSLPAGATIDGILVEIKRRETSTVCNVFDYRVQLLDASGSLVGNNKANANEWTASPEAETISYGGALDTWDASPTEAMVENSNFGIVLSILATSGFGSHEGWVFFIRITVYYTAITEKTSSDSGSGADDIASGYPQVTLAKTDTGSGIDAKEAHMVSLAGVETGSGADAAVTRLASILGADVGVGNDLLASLVVGILKSDTGIGADVLVDLLASFIGTDAGTGIDALAALVVLLTKSDAGQGQDVIVQLLALLSATDVGAGVDALVSLLVVRAELDVGTGTDAVTSRLADLIKADVGLGVDAVTLLLVARAAADAGVGADEIVELVQGLVELLSTDSGVGTDEVVSHLVSLVKSDSGIGTEAWKIQVIGLIILQRLILQRIEKTFSLGVTVRSLNLEKEHLLLDLETDRRQLDLDAMDKSFSLTKRRLP